MPLVRRFAPWLPPLLLMALIFFLSAQPNLSSGLGVIDLVGRKLVHAGLYALLATLWWRALRPLVRPGTALTVALAIAVGYAITDELHQTFVPSRSGTPLDVAIDTAGAGLASLLIRRRGSRGAPRGSHGRRRTVALPAEGAAARSTAPPPRT